MKNKIFTTLIFFTMTQILPAQQEEVEEKYKSNWEAFLRVPVGAKIVSAGGLDFNHTFLVASLMIGESYKITKKFALEAAVGIGAQYRATSKEHLSKITYAVPFEFGMIYEVTKNMSTSGGIGYGFGGFVNDFNIYLGINFVKNFGIRASYSPYVDMKINNMKLKGTGYGFVALVGIF